MLKREIYKNRYIYLLLIPGLLFYLLFSYWPMYGIQIAFKDFMFNKGIWGSPWAGLKHFERLLTEDMFLRAFRNTLEISFLRLLIGNPVPIILAILLNEMANSRYKKVMQTVFTLPHFLSWIVVSGLVFNFLGYSGTVNQLLDLAGLQKVVFLGTPGLFRPVLFISEIWKSAGWGSVIYLAALTGINPELYDAAYVDGANRFHRIIHISLPAISPTIVLLYILAIGNSMDAGFQSIFNLYNPVVYEVSDIIDTYIYRMTFVQGGDFSFSTAVGLFKSIVNVVLLLSANKLARKLTGNALI